MHQAREVSPQGERQQQALRRAKREYMRRWRANPANRARVTAMHQRQTAKRKADHSRDTGEATCGFCFMRTPVASVERLIATPAGFKPVDVPCCAACLA